MIDGAVGYYSKFFEGAPPVQRPAEEGDGFPLDPWRLGIKTLSRVLSWADLFFNEAVFSLTECKHLIGRIGVIGQIYDLPKQMRKIGKAVKEWQAALLQGITWELGAKTTNVYIETASITSFAADSIQLTKDAGYLSLSATQLLFLDIIGFMGSFSLFLSSSIGIAQYGWDFLFREIGSPEHNLSLIKLAGKILLLALSIIGMVTFATGGVFNRVALLMLSTALLLASSIARYYKRSHVEHRREIS